MRLNLRRAFELHELKLLNLSLLVYICAGALLFDALGDLRPSARPECSVVKSNSTRASDSLKHTSTGELRALAARRMWNITNQLNILYESNWTKLVLDELVEFERALVRTLANCDDNDDDSPDLELELEAENEDSDKKRSKEKQSQQQQQQQQRRRKRSIARSLVHSIATLTTIG